MRDNEIMSLLFEEDMILGFSPKNCHDPIGIYFSHNNMTSQHFIFLSDNNCLLLISHQIATALLCLHRNVLLLKITLIQLSS